MNDAARGRREVVVRVLGVEPHFDRVAVDGWRLALETFPSRYVQLELNEVETGCRFRYRVLDLQPRIHLDERELPGDRVVEELDRSCVVIPGL